MKILVNMLGPAIGCIIGAGIATFDGNVVAKVLIAIIAMFVLGAASNTLANRVSKTDGVGRPISIFLSWCIIIVAVVLTSLMNSR